MLLSLFNHGSSSPTFGQSCRTIAWMVGCLLVCLVLIFVCVPQTIPDFQIMLSLVQSTTTISQQSKLRSKKHKCLQLAHPSILMRYQQFLGFIHASCPSQTYPPSLAAGCRGCSNLNMRMVIPRQQGPWFFKALSSTKKMASPAIPRTSISTATWDCQPRQMDWDSEASGG